MWLNVPVSAGCSGVRHTSQLCFIYRVDSDVCLGPSSVTSVVLGRELREREFQGTFARRSIIKLLYGFNKQQ